MDRDSFTSRFAGMDTRRGGLVSCLALMMVIDMLVTLWLSAVVV